MEAKKQDGGSAIEVIEAFEIMVMEHRAREAIETFVSPDFVEHNPTIKGGRREGLYSYMLEEGWAEDSPNRDLVDVVDRRITDGEYVVTHHHIFRNKEDRGTVYVDIFRVVDGLIVEHWDVFQSVPERTNDNPHTMW